MSSISGGLSHSFPLSSQEPTAGREIRATTSWNGSCLNELKDMAKDALKGAVMGSVWQALGLFPTAYNNKSAMVFSAAALLVVDFPPYLSKIEPANQTKETKMQATNAKIALRALAIGTIASVVAARALELTPPSQHWPLAVTCGFIGYGVIARQINAMITATRQTALNESLEKLPTDTDVLENHNKYVEETKHMLQLLTLINQQSLISEDEKAATLLQLETLVNSSLAWPLKLFGTIEQTISLMAEAGLPVEEMKLEIESLPQTKEPMEAILLKSIHLLLNTIKEKNISTDTMTLILNKMSKRIEEEAVINLKRLK